ncbi:MAG: LysO family transporter [Prevotella sp.]|nr:LysO family transporter [Prevotella sp.]
MLNVVAIMFCGIGVGWLLRHRRLTFISRIITVLIWALLLCLGIEVGMNPQVISRLSDLGLEAVVMCLAGMAGSLALSWALWRVVLKKKGGPS